MVRFLRNKYYVTGLPGDFVMINLDPLALVKRLYHSPWPWVLLGLLLYWSCSYLFLYLTEWVASRAEISSPLMGGYVCLSVSCKILANNGGKTVILTGGSQGMGKAVAELLAKKGANVLIVARTVGKLEAALKDISVRY
jgi:hypothetical protein